MKSFIIKSFENFNDSRKSLCLFDKSDIMLMEDLLLEYIDKYNLINIDDVNQKNENDIYYEVNCARNLFIDITGSWENIDLIKEIWDDIKKNLIERTKKLGYNVHHAGIDGPSISIVFRK